MLNFYLITAVLLVVAMIWWFIAARLKTDVASVELEALAREQVNTHQLRIKELGFAKEHDEMDDKEYDATVIELKKQLLHDLSSSAGPGSAQIQVVSAKPLALFVPGCLFLVCFVVAFYWSNGQPAKLQEWEQSIDLMPALGKRAVMNEGETLSPKELQQFALGLRTKLHHDDSDAVAWLLLGRVTQALNDLESAKLAFAKAYKLDPAKMAIQLNYAQVLLMSGGEPSMRQAGLLLSKVLRQDPKSVDALLMIAYIAEQMGNIEQATNAWQALLTYLDKDDSRLAFVEQKLREVKASEIAQAHSAQSSDVDSADAAATNAKITVHLTLSEELVGKVPEGATLFVYAKAASGPPMPAAVIKLNTFELPLTVELTDANAMMDSYKLSSLKQLVIRTRVSQDQDIAISPGELQGQSPVFSLSDTTEISVVINQVL
ncbi:MAG: cytochrome c-type biogenesis protein CcmI [Phenylobacterium sp.]|jgi:cytochrome c-type biogenesis protein CcmI